MRKDQTDGRIGLRTSARSRWAKAMGLLAIVAGFPAAAASYQSTVNVPAANGKPATKVVCTMTLHPFRTILTALNRELVAADMDIWCSIPAGSPGATSPKPSVTSVAPGMLMQLGTVLSHVTDTRWNVDAPNYNGYTYRAWPAQCKPNTSYLFYKRASASISIYVPYSNQRVSTSISSLFEPQNVTLRYC